MISIISGMLERIRLCLKPFPNNFESFLRRNSIAAKDETDVILHGVSQIKYYSEL